MTKRRRFLQSSALAALAAGGLLGCAAQSGVGFNQVLGYDGLGRKIRAFYARRAWEEGANCPLPTIRVLLRAERISETPDGFIALVRYSWQDERRNDSGSGGRGSGRRSGTKCRGIRNRQFTIRTAGGGAEVISMSGTQRPNPLGATQL